MNKKLIVGIAVIGVLSIGTVANALFNSEPAKQNQATLQRSEPSEESLVQSSTVETPVSSKVDLPSAEATVQDQPEAPQTAPAVAEEPFDAQLYAMTVLQEKAQQGIGANAECFTKLMVEAHGWNLTKNQTDQAIEKVFGYSSTCAAYAQFKATGSY